MLSAYQQAMKVITTEARSPSEELSGCPTPRNHIEGAPIYRLD
jgi:hypothetical protein